MTKQIKRAPFKYVPDQFNRPPESDDFPFQKIKKRPNKWKKGGGNRDASEAPASAARALRGAR